MEQDQALRDFYEFTDADLATNRSGQLTDGQLKTIQGRNNTFRIMGLAGGGCAILIALLLCLLLVAVVALSFVTRDWSNSIVGLIALVAGIVVMGGGGTAFLFFGLSKSKAAGVLRSTQGKVTLTSADVSSSHGRSYKEYSMQIGGVEFVLDDELVGHIREGETYAIYYVDYQDGSEGIIQSAERLA